MKTKGPKLTVLTNCFDCEYLNNDFCEKLKVKLNKTTSLTQMEYDSKTGVGSGTENNYFVPHENCPFLEKNSEDFYSTKFRQITEIKNYRKLELKNKIFSIFDSVSNYEDNDNSGFIFFETTEICWRNILEFQKLLPDYGFNIESKGKFEIISLVSVFKKV